MTVTLIAIVMTKTESKDLLFYFFKGKFMIIPHAQVFFRLFILFSWDMNRTIVMLSETSGNDLCITLIRFDTLTAALLKHSGRCKNLTVNIMRC